MEAIIHLKLRSCLCVERLLLWRMKYRTINFVRGVLLQASWETFFLSFARNDFESDRKLVQEKSITLLLWLCNGTTVAAVPRCEENYSYYELRLIETQTTESKWLILVWFCSVTSRKWRKWEKFLENVGEIWLLANFLSIGSQSNLKPSFHNQPLPSIRRARDKST